MNGISVLIMVRLPECMAHFKCNICLLASQNDIYIVISNALVRTAHPNLPKLCFLFKNLFKTDSIFEL